MRIDQISFAADRAYDVIGRMRDNAVTTDVDEAMVDSSGQVTDPTEGAETTALRTNLYELSIDAA